jgi:DNA-binding response OmpR family regulator
MNHKILFIHTDPKLVQLYQQGLEKHFLFDSANDGLAALRKIRVYRPSLIVSEMNLPSVSGMAILRYVRKHPHFSTIPFVFFSDELDAQEALSLGATDWLDRRFVSPHQLLDKIFNHLQQSYVSI